VARCFKDLKNYFSELDGVTLGVCRDRKLRSSFGGSAIANSCARCCGEFKVAGQEVGVEMGLENMANCESIGFGFSEVFRNIALRINNDCFTSRPISNEIAGMRETFQIELLEVQSGGRENWAHAQTIPPRVSFVNLTIPADIVFFIFVFFIFKKCVTSSCALAI
jgi:hypothetical protein